MATSETTQNQRLNDYKQEQQQKLKHLQDTYDTKINELKNIGLVPAQSVSQNLENSEMMEVEEEHPTCHSPPDPLTPVNESVTETALQIDNDSESEENGPESTLVTVEPGALVVEPENSVPENLTECSVPENATQNFEILRSSTNSISRDTEMSAGQTKSEKPDTEVQVIQSNITDTVDNIRQVLKSNQDLSGQILKLDQETQKLKQTQAGLLDFQNQVLTLLQPKVNDLLKFQAETDNMMANFKVLAALKIKINEKDFVIKGGNLKFRA